MNSVLRTEWLKLRSYKPFWVMAGLYAICLIGMAGIGLRLQSWAGETPKLNVLVAASPPFGYPKVWHSVAYLASYLQFIPSLLIILNVTNEFTFRTHRQNLLEGWSRLQFLGAKLAVALGITLWCTVAVMICTVLAGALGGHAPSPAGLEYIARFAMQTLTYVVFALFLGFLIRRAALALGAFFIYSVVFERIVAFFANLYVKGIGYFMPLESANGLLPMPYLEQATKNFMQGPPPEALFGATLIWLTLCLSAIWLRFRHEDL